MAVYRPELRASHSGSLYGSKTFNAIPLNIVGYKPIFAQSIRTGRPSIGETLQAVLCLKLIFSTMKTLFAFTLALAALAPAQAQIFRSSLDSAVAGAVVGGIIGNNSGHGNGARGAAIGAGVGVLLNEASRGGSSVSVGYSSGHRGGRGYGYYNGGYSSGYRGNWGRPYYSSGWSRPYSYYPRYSYRPAYYSYGWPLSYSDYGYYSYPSYDYDYDLRPYYGSNSSYRGAGLVLGGLAGAIIGNNSGRGNGLQGAAIGAGAGYLLGAVADSDAQYRAQRQVAAERAASASYEPVTSAPATGQVPQNVTIINNYYNSSPMSSANTLFGR